MGSCIRCAGALLIAAIVMLAVTGASSESSQDARRLRAELAPFAFLLGEWEVETSFRRADGTMEQARAHSTFTTSLLGGLIEEHLEGTRDGEPFAVRALLCHSDLRQGLQFAWIDHEHGMTMYDGRIGAPGEFVFEYALELRGRTHILQRGFRDIGRDSFTSFSRRSADDRATWRETWTARYARHDPAP